MTKTALKLAFAGTPEIARTVLEALLEDNHHTVQKVFTQPDRPSGRGRKLKQSDVKCCALEHGLTVYQPESSKELEPGLLNDCDLMLVVAYGLLITPEVLTTPRLGCVNIHTSLLPRWRGAAPIQRAIEAGDKQTGITIMQMDNGLDTGPILEQLQCPIYDDDTGGKLHDRLAKISAESISPILSKLSKNEIEPVKQNDTDTTYANKISKQEALLDWNRPALELERKVRAFNPFPIAHTRINNISMRIWEAKAHNQDKPGLVPGTPLNNKGSLEVVTGEGTLEITKLQLPGKKPVSSKDFLNGHPDFFR